MSEDAAETAETAADEEETETETETESSAATDESADAGPGDGEGATSLVDEVEGGDDSPVEVARRLADRVADGDVDPDAVADDLRALADRVEDVAETAEERAERVEELEGKLKRKQAEFENYKKRQEREREELKERATEAFVERVVAVRDNLVRALDQDEDADLRDGLRSTLDTFDEVLAEENVEPIEPDPGTDVDPVRHEVLMRAESDHPEGTIVDVYRPGYEMAGRVVQTAQVTVSEGGDEAGDETADQSGTEADDGDDGDDEAVDAATDENAE